MDFRFSEEQDALRELAREIFEGEVTPERLGEVEVAGDFFDRELWARLAEANLLGLAIPEAQGGMGMGFLELCLLCSEAGRSVAPLPILPALVLAGLPLARFGSDAQRERWLAPLATGESVLTAALDIGPAVEARRDGDVLVLDGVCKNVPAVGLAQRVLVPTEIDGSQALVLVDPQADGVSTEGDLISCHEPLYELTLAGVRLPAEDALVADGIVDWTTERARVAAAAVQVGVSERALEITVDFLKEREQFGAPLATLPPVQHRCADSYIALDALRWMTWQTAWKLAAEKEARRDTLATKFWAANAGSQIGTATQHLHGGMGVDVDYPIHRYFLRAKQIELFLGGATPTLLELGADMALTGPQELA
ncbi:MAG: acyl-CoA/acyl-ACP dehydrogenase [Deltaproteobacteria bacterium]|nr:acyl-CoA/acyl-ACP dehydrogenase [Deltaproteobacteria bacterium]